MYSSYSNATGKKKDTTLTPSRKGIFFVDRTGQGILRDVLPPMEEIYKKLTFDYWNPHKILKSLLRSFYLNGHTSQTQKVQPPIITQ